ncbi:MAG: ferrous iron transport protein B [Chitinophagales bacterium]|nr:ferrous iron transport protein B [Chitinophagaceae bacterium]MBP9883050.1 ferrous iron transport protein B [Chitinophagales bacterium]
MKKNIKIALVGNPNCGKSSLFNALTGLRQKVGNFAGVTVDKKTGYISLAKDTIASIIDLPGTYSLYPRRIDEFITFDVLLNADNDSHPDMLVIVADASNLKRNLLFCSQIIDLKIPTIIALNMVDVARKNGLAIDTQQLAIELGVKVIPINAREGKGINDLKRAIQTTVPVPEKNFVEVRPLCPEVVDGVKEITKVTSDYTAFQIACHYINIFCFNVEQKGKIKQLLEQHHFAMSKLQGEEILQRYERINAILDRCTSQDQSRQQALDTTARIDAVLLHPVYGYLIFLLIFYFVFQAIFSWATYPMEAIGAAFSWMQESLDNLLPESLLTNLLLEGVLAGIGGIVIFIPQIMLLFGFISILEDTGYMTRVSFLMDRLMRKVGMSGKSTLPLVSGMACAVPAILSTRGIENWKDRIITIMVTPLMSCSARLPVYALLISFIVPDEKFLGFMNLKGLVMMGLYLLGWAMALLAAFVMKLIIKAKEKSYYLMELPIYRKPRWGNVGITMIEKAKVFVTDAGKVIITISIILWFLASFGPGNSIEVIEEKYASMQPTESITQTDLNNQLQAEKLAASFAGRIGHFIEPAIKPLGFDWKIGIALITSFAAREVFVGTMSTIYSVGSTEDVDFEAIRERMRNEIDPETGEHVYSAATAFSLMIFFAFAMQCMSTVAVVKRETKSWKWPSIQILYLTGLAYLSSLIVYQWMK